MGDTAAALSPKDKRALLARLLQEEAAPLQIFPMSFGQQRLWFLHQLAPGNAAYNEPTVLQLTGRLDVGALEQCLNELVRRHETLRTSFASVDGQAVQIISPPFPVRLVLIHLEDLPASERKTRMADLLLEQVQQPFDLSQSPVFRVSLLRLGEREHVLLTVTHHIVFDGWSRDIFIRELFALYQAFAAGAVPQLPALPVQYVDYAAWQHEWLQGAVLQAQLTYWKEKLAGELPTLQMPADHPRSPIQTFRGATRSFTIPQVMVDALKAVGRQDKATLFMTLLAAYKVLLYRYTGQTDILVGAPVANRNQAEVEGLIGFFANTLALRTRLADELTFRDLLGRVRQVVLEALAHQEMPFEKLVDVLHLDRNLSHTPLFQVAFAFQSVRDSSTFSWALPGLVWKRLDIDTGMSKFDLTLSLVELEGGQGVVGGLEYNSDLFDETTITRMLDHFQMLLRSIVSDPGQCICKLPVLTELERQQILFDWNATQTDFPHDVCFHQLFEEQSARTPDAIALVYRDQHLSYRELNARANQLAHHLQSLGVGPEIAVGVCMERCAEMVVGFLGILKAGGVYVPLDPAYPQERLAFMLQDAGIQILLTHQELSHSLISRLESSVSTVLCLDTDWSTIARHSPSNPISAVTAQNLVYIIYTSGSTGVPKGTLIAHRGLCNVSQAQIQRFDLGASDRILQLASLSFDASIFEIVMALRGGTLCLEDRESLLPGKGLIRLLNDLNVTMITITPSALAALPVEDLPALRVINVAGEACPAELVARWMEGRRFFNLYGPTEGTIWTTAAECVDVDRRPPIGQPVANTQVYILDKGLCPVPIGVRGELYIGGVGLARGYLDRPALTAERFIPHPFSDRPGARLYKTGDLARWLPSGDIEYLGRADFQVKLRGFRIELSEIEAVLAQHPAVREAVALLREDRPDHKQLVAYIVQSHESRITSRELGDYVRHKLPDYMVPSAFVFLDVLPLTPSGKVDWRALPEPERGSREESYVAPRNAVEELLATIWADVLRVEQVGVHDNFFELGGDSILSIQIVARANQAGLSITPAQLFQGQTLAELAPLASPSPAVQTEQGLVTGRLPLTPIQRWFLDQKWPNPHHWNMALLLEARARLNASWLEQALQRLVEHHDALRLRFEAGQSGWQQMNADLGGSATFIRVDLSVLAADEHMQAIDAKASELHASLNLSAGPLVRSALFELGPQQPQRLLIIIHHMAVDGVSWRILLEDLETIYRQLEQGQPVQLPSKTTSFREWARRLEVYAQSPGLQSELEYWLQARGAFVPLPTDLAGLDANTQASAHAVTVSLNAQETRALLQEVPAAYQTQINDVLLTALVQALNRWTGQASALIDMEGHGREEIIEGVDLSRTVGWFTTLYPVYLHLDTTLPGQALKSVKEQLRRVPNKGIGYGLLRYLTQDAGTTAAVWPQAELSFNYLGRFDQMLPAGSLFQRVQEFNEAARSPEGRRTHLLSVDAIISGGCLQLRWSYSENVHRHATIERLAGDFTQALRALIDHCQSPEAGGYTPSDFPEASLSQQELDALLVELG
ncbi:MAG: amino acid adenylation domain-containing protein [Thermoflexales bacterium]|nr:amino acid adenylation domain-containing protein [Thermoflexales bacterium]